MISERLKDDLKSQWGEKADALQAYVLVKLQSQFWNWFLYAMNPHNEDEVCCISNDFFGHQLKIEVASLENILSSYDERGEFPKIDIEFRPMKAETLYKKLTI